LVEDGCENTPAKIGGPNCVFATGRPSASSDKASGRRGGRLAQQLVDETDAVDHRGRPANDAQGRFAGQRIHVEPFETFRNVNGRGALKLVHHRSDATTSIGDRRRLQVRPANQQPSGHGLPVARETTQQSVQHVDKH